MNHPGFRNASQDEMNVSVGCLYLEGVKYLQDIVININTVITVYFHDGIFGDPLQEFHEPVFAC